MAITLFSIKPLLETLFKILNKSTNYFANAYLLKDVSLVSKWKTGKVIPKNEDISKIVEFVNSESTGMQRHLIRNKLEEYINESSLDISLKNMLLEIEDFSLFLTEVLILSISNTDEYSDSVTVLNNEVTEEPAQHEEAKVLDVFSDSHGFQSFFKVFSNHLHKARTKKIIFLVLALCVAVFIFQQFNKKDSANTIYLSNSSLTDAQNTIQLSNKYIMSYTHISDSNEEVEVDINGIPIQFRSSSPLLFDDVLYLPFGEAFINMGFSFVDFNGSTKICKEMRTGQTVIAEVGTKELQINDKIVMLTDPIRMGKHDLYIPADSLQNFTSYLDKMIPQNIGIKIDNKADTSCKNLPRIVDDKLYLSFRYIFETFGFNVCPDRTMQKETSIAIAKKDTKIVKVEESKDYAIVNDNLVPLSSPIFLSGYITYVPVDIIEKVLNMDYNWDKDKKTLEIKTGRSK